MNLVSTCGLLMAVVNVLALGLTGPATVARACCLNEKDFLKCMAMLETMKLWLAPESTKALTFLVFFLLLRNMHHSYQHRDWILQQLVLLVASQVWMHSDV